MTLVITEVSRAGIAMMTDTTIFSIDTKTRAIRVDIPPQQRAKLFTMEKLAAAVSYWGSIGFVPDFDNWLRGKIQQSVAQNLTDFAEELASSLNEQCRGEIIAHPMGLHVAGYDAWPNAYPYPKFFHVHNGHLTSSLILTDSNKIAIAPTGSANVTEKPRTWEEGQRRGLVANHTGSRTVVSQLVEEPRGPFKAHLDFPSDGKNLSENLQTLDRGYLTANGDYFRLTLKREYEALMAARGLRARPAVPSESGYLEKSLAWMVDSAERIRADMAQGGAIPTFGGPYQSLAIDENGFRYINGPYLPTT